MQENPFQEERQGRNVDNLMKVGMGYDVHRLTENRNLILGGVKIPWEKGLLGESMKATILLAEDEQAMREVLTDYFTAKSGGDFTVVSAPDGDTALHFIETRRFDLLLLDIMLPGMDGFALCRAAREQGDAPILFVTAREDEQDKLHGYGLGADDYVVKPFSLAVLYAKALALLRRARGLNAENTLTAGTLSLDPERGIVTADGRRIDLPPKEFALLRALMERKNRVLTRDELLNLAWGWDFDGTDRVIDGHIKKLRRALGPHADCIKTVVKRGYKLEVDGDENQT